MISEEHWKALLEIYEGYDGYSNVDPLPEVALPALKAVIYEAMPQWIGIDLGNGPSWSVDSEGNIIPTKPKSST